MTSSLRLADAIPLAQALVSDTARRIGVRSLLIKGSTLSHHGLRPERISTDVDVMLAGEDSEAFEAELVRIGWRRRIGRIDGYPETHHSTAYIHDSWPCDIDVHYRFPGFLAAPAGVFESLWDSRTTMTAAGQRVEITGFGGSVLVLALHAARSGGHDRRHLRELAGLVDGARTWSESQREEVSRIAAETGAARALSEFLPTLGLDPEIRQELVEPELLVEWTRYVTGNSSSTRNWIRYLVGGSVWELPVRLATVAWPSEERLRPYGFVRDEPAPLAKARLRWWAKGARSLWRITAARFGVRERNVLDDVNVALTAPRGGEVPEGSRPDAE